MKNNPPMHITSSNNPVIKQFIKLHQAKHRKDSGLCLVETLHPIEEAIEAGLDITHLAIQAEKLQHIQLDTSTVKQVLILPEVLMKKISTTSSAPELAAIVKVPVHKNMTVKKNALLLWELQDPGNMGTLIRSAVAFGCKTIICIGGAELFSPKVIRASAGQIFQCTAMQANDISEILDDAALSSINWYGLDAHTGQDYRDLQPKEPFGFVLGSEGHGLPNNSQIKMQMVHIPMTNHVESLNVSIAGSIVLSHLFKTI